MFHHASTRLENDTVFPITLSCDESGAGAYHYQSHFLKSKPKDLIWYGYDTVIRSETDVEFVVYDMRDNCHGGLGKKISAFSTKVAPSVTKRDIERKCFQLAADRCDRELRSAELAIIQGYADEILSSIAPAQAEQS